MASVDTLLLTARRQVVGVLRRWDAGSGGGVSRTDIDALVDPVLSALAFEPSVVELAADLQEIMGSRTSARPTWSECLSAARDLLDDHRLLSVTVAAA